MLESENNEIEKILQEESSIPVSNNIEVKYNTQEDKSNILSNHTQIINQTDINETDINENEIKNIEYSMNKILNMVNDAYKILPDVNENEVINTVKAAAYAWNTGIEKSVNENLTNEEMLNNALTNAKNILFDRIKNQYNTNQVGGKKKEN